MTTAPALSPAEQKVVDRFERAADPYRPLSRQERFALDVADHEMTVAHDHDGYLHLKFRKPGTGMYWVDLIVWPGTLAVRGDMGTFVFHRSHDMLEFFRGQRVNAQYWAEKEQSGTELRRYDVEQVERHVHEAVDAEDLACSGRTPEEIELIQEAAAELLKDWYLSSEHHAHALLAEFRVRLNPDEPDEPARFFTFHDTWEWNLREYTTQYLWCCEAIAWAIASYDAMKALT